MSEYDSQIRQRRLHIRKLVSALYRVTALLPEDDTLRVKLREEGLTALQHTEHILNGSEPERYRHLVTSVQTLVHYCEIAGQEHRGQDNNFSALKHAFFNFRNDLENMQNIEREVTVAASTKGPATGDVRAKTTATGGRDRKSNTKTAKGGLSARQQKIVRHLRDNRHAQVADLSSLFPKVTSRTIRRDLDKLQSKKIVKKIGNTNRVKYKLA